MNTHTQPAIRRSKISIAILMQKRASAVKNWIACKIDQPRVGKSLERLAETRLRGPTVNVASFALPCPPASHFSPCRLCFLFRGPILIPPLAAHSLLYTTLVHVVSLRTAGKILYSCRIWCTIFDREIMHHAFKMESFLSHRDANIESYPIPIEHNSSIARERRP